MTTLYDVTIPGFLHSLGSLSKIIEKGRAYAAENGIAETDLVSSRLAPDMLTLAGQVQRASDSARFAAVRVGGVAPKPMADEEKTLDELQARIAATVDFLKAVPPESFEGKDGIEVTVKAGSRELEFTGQSYIAFFAIPNFYFHVTTAYDILRHKGVPIGKRDFLGG